MSIQNYTVIFKDLTYSSNVSEHHLGTINRFVWGLWPKIRRVMITDSYDLNTIEESFIVALKIDLTFKMLVNAKIRCSKCKRYGQNDYQHPMKSQHVGIMPSNDVGDLKVVNNLHLPYKTASITEDISVGFDKQIIDEIHMSSDRISDDMDEIVKLKTPAVLGKSFEFLVLNIILWSFQSIHLSSESPEFLTMIQ